MQNVTIQQFWEWDKIDNIGREEDMFTLTECCTYFENELWFELVNIMWRKHQITLQDHVKYIHNDILKPFRFGILQYSGHVREMHNLAKYLPPPSMKGEEYDEADWNICSKQFSEDEICVETRDRVPKYMLQIL